MIDLLSRFDEVGAARAKTRAENHKRDTVSNISQKGYSEGDQRNKTCNQ